MPFSLRYQKSTKKPSLKARLPAWPTSGHGGPLFGRPASAAEPTSSPVAHGQIGWWPPTSTADRRLRDRAGTLSATNQGADGRAGWNMKCALNPSGITSRISKRERRLLNGVSANHSRRRSHRPVSAARVSFTQVSYAALLATAGGGLRNACAATPSTNRRVSA